MYDKDNSPHGNVISTTRRIKSFEVPDGVYEETNDVGLRQQGFKPKDLIPLSSLSEETLTALCDQFKIDVFKQAGKIIPVISMNKNIQPLLDSIEAQRVNAYYKSTPDTRRVHADAIVEQVDKDREDKKDLCAGIYYVDDWW